MPTLRKRNEPTATRSRWGGVWEIRQMRVAPLSAHGVLPEVTQRFARAVEDLPYLERVLKILLAHRHVCAKYLVLELLVNVADTNATLWLSGYLLSVIATDPQLHARTLVLALLANTLLPVVTFLLRDLLRTYENYLQEKIQRYFILHMIKVRARLDAVTTDDPLVAAQLAAADPDDASGEEQVQAWRLLWALLRTVMLVVSLLCSVSLSTSTLHQHPSVIPLAIAALIKPIVQAATPFLGFEQQSSVWVAVARDKRYLRFRGLRASLSSPALRKEIVAGNLGSYIAKECARLAVELKDGFLSRFSTNALPQSPWFTAESATMVIVKQLPLAVLVFLVLTSRENVALLLGSLGVVQQVLTSFDDATYTLRYRSADVVNGLTALRQKCELINLRNKVQSGELPFPDDNGDAVSIEFECVHPTSSRHARRNRAPARR